ncbi:MAG: anthranilate synthase component I [Puniceicoccales bacterium]|jgi:anthranilate synthase component 1|nr:anthranilate synthase component I [Puniceicoccales bacterium]
MKIFPDKDAFRLLAQHGNVVPVCTDLMADLETPVSVYAKLRERGPAFLLESVTGGERISRYSFAGARPKQTITAWADRTTVTGRDGRVETFPTPPDPLALVERIITPCRPVVLPDMPPFTGGAVGFAGYEYIHCIEPAVPPAARDELGVPLLHFMIMDCVVMFDHARQLIRLCVNAFTDEAASPDEAWERAAAELKSLLGALAARRALAPTALCAEPGVTPPPPGNFTREDFESAVLRAREYIHAGDGVQVVLSQRFERDFSADPLNLYRVLRYINPSPYMFILEGGAGFQIVGASPEVNVRLTGKAVGIRPIAGTRPRGRSEPEDRLLEKELLADEKELSEHLMLVDLARNDIGRVCVPGSVTVSEYAAVERYSHVMHIVSQVEGRLRDGQNAFDLFRATFPAGTLSGAPKIRAMQIISELEGTRRGFYGGALGYFSFSGNHDSCIAIRSALLKDGKAWIQAGAGIVADSVPGNEYMEAINKSMSVVKAAVIAEQLTDAGA